MGKREALWGGLKEDFIPDLSFGEMGRKAGGTVGTVGNWAARAVSFQTVTA